MEEREQEFPVPSPGPGEENPIERFQKGVDEDEELDLSEFEEIGEEVSEHEEDGGE